MAQAWRYACTCPRSCRPKDSRFPTAEEAGAEEAGAAEEEEEAAEAEAGEAAEAEAEAEAGEAEEAEAGGGGGCGGAHPSVVAFNSVVLERFPAASYAATPSV